MSRTRQTYSEHRENESRDNSENGSAKSSNVHLNKSDCCHTAAGASGIIENANSMHSFESRYSSISDESLFWSFSEKLMQMNKNFIKKMNSQIASNPLYLLTPCFTEYERQLKQLDAEYENMKKTSDSRPNFAVEHDSKEKKPKSELSFCAVHDPSCGSLFPPVKSTLSFGTPADTIVHLIPSASSSQWSFPTSSVSLFLPVKSTLSFGTPADTLEYAKKSATALKPKELSFHIKPNYPLYQFGPESNSKSESKILYFNKENEQHEPRVEYKKVMKPKALDIYECHVWIKELDDNDFVDRGNGVLRFESNKSSKKNILNICAESNPNDILVDLILDNKMSVQRKDLADIMISVSVINLYVPVIILRTKTTKEADKLLNVINMHKK